MVLSAQSTQRVLSGIIIIIIIIIIVIIIVTKMITATIIKS